MTVVMVQVYTLTAVPGRRVAVVDDGNPDAALEVLAVDYDYPDTDLRQVAARCAAMRNLPVVAS